MHPSPLQGRWNIIKSTYVEAKGAGLTTKFSRLWLSLTAHELLFYRDSTCSLSKANAVIACNSIAYVEQDPSSSEQLRVHTTIGDIELKFRSSEDLKVWKGELDSVLKPVLCIGESYLHDSHQDQVWNSESSYRLLDHPYSMRNDSSVYESELYDEVASLPGPSGIRDKRESVTSVSSDATTLVAGSSRAGSRHSRQFSLQSASTRVSESPYWKSPWVSDQFTKSWTDLSDLLTAVEDEFTDNVNDAGRPPSPLDPDLVFDSGRVFFSVSEAPNPRTECAYFDLTGQITKIGNFPVATGGYADIWCGEWEAGDGPKTVAIKVIRSFSNNFRTDEKIKKRLAQELDIWTKLRHRNIIPLFGVVYDLGRHASMVSPWMQRGNAAKYFEELDSRASLQMRLKALCEVACGMEYLHCFYPPVIHGDLKASNVLINENGEAVLADFGISAVIEEATGSCRFTSSSFAGSVRWMAFELIRVAEESTPHLTTHSDIWSYGSTVLEILTGKVPYHHRKNDIQVLHEIMRGIKPRRPDLISEDIWDFLQTCWRDDPPSRPNVSVVRQSMDKFYRRSKRHAVELNLDLNV